MTELTKEEMIKAIWKKIKWFDNYEISNKWEVRKVYKKWYKSMAIYNSWNWYYKCNLSRDKKQHFLLIHRLIAENFIGDITWKVVCHKDDNPSNNDINNLFIWTHKDNSIDMVNKWRQNTPKWEKKIKSSKLKFQEVKQIRKLRWKYTTRELWIMFNISQSVICNIQNYKAWNIKENP